MGLDSFWEHPDDREGAEVAHPEFDPPLRLCGGMFSGHGSGSFRGKVYDSDVQAVTGVSLYQEVIDNDTVRQMAAKLWGAYGASDYHPVDQEQYDLARMFKAYAAAGFVLKGWW